MVARMMKWLPWPPYSSRRFQVCLTVHTLEGVQASPVSDCHGVQEGMLVDVKWKGPKAGFFRRRSLKRTRTAIKQAMEDGIFRWEEETDYECVFTEAKHNNSFQPWDVHFVVLKAIKQGGKNRKSVVGTAILNIADLISTNGYNPKTIRVNVTGAESTATLVVTVNFLDLCSSSENGDSAHSRSSVPCMSSDYSNPQPLTEGALDKVAKTAKRPAEGKVSQELYVVDSLKLSSRSEGAIDTGALFESDSAEEYDDGGIENSEDSSFRKSFSYGTLAGVNLVLEGALPSFREGEVESERLSSIHNRVLSNHMPKLNEESLASDSDQAVVQTMRSLLSWKKRKLSFRSPRARGEPLLNKAYGDDGGDDIDHDRRQSCASPSEQLLAVSCKDENGSTPIVSGCLDFGDDMFSVGCWEKKDFVSRDGHMKLFANVFFASIDQRNERAAGESACTALVAVIAEWLHRNPNRMPIKTEFDSLIREGSAEWRRLCENESYQNRFPDGHFDLDTVLEAKVRPLRVAPERSYVGFFQPEGLSDECDFLQGAMLFDNIWDAIVEETNNMEPGYGCEPVVYIVSWNDHFFILKVDHDAYYVIDTLGERLHEGCNQAYIIRFDKDARLYTMPKSQNDGEQNIGVLGSSLTRAGSSSPTSSISCKQSAIGPEYSSRLDDHISIEQQKSTVQDATERGCEDETQVIQDKPICEGKEACKCFLKEFFAAVPLRELQVDIRKGLLGKLPLHQRLQIEFHFMSLDSSVSHQVD